MNPEQFIVTATRALDAIRIDDVKVELTVSHKGHTVEIMDITGLSLAEIKSELKDRLSGEPIPAQGLYTWTKTSEFGTITHSVM